MYEWVKTATGWRIFWGIDPCAAQPEAAPLEPDRDVLTVQTVEGSSLPADSEPEIHTSA